MQCKYFNLAGTYIPFLQRCVAERLWIHTSQRWHGPYDWAWRFGVTNFGLDWIPTLADPYALITQARQDISAGKPLDFPSQSGYKGIVPEPVPTEKVLVSLEKFQKRVDDYYISGKDALLLKSIETGIWH